MEPLWYEGDALPHELTDIAQPPDESGSETEDDLDPDYDDFDATDEDSESDDDWKAYVSGTETGTLYWSHNSYLFLL